MENGRLNREIWAVVMSFTALLILVSLFTADVLRLLPAAAP